MLFTQTALAVSGLASLASSHMIMNTPVPYGKSTLNNSPLLASGADFPCKQRSGVYAAEGASNVMALGSSQPLKFTGGATHGGGSCQISITYDQAPTASSTFKVIHSIEGGCPIQGVAGNNADTADAVDPSTYSFPIPSSLPTGNATLAWTWFNKVGNREMYMNCAPVTLTGSTSKRGELDERDTSAFNALPDMFVANLASINTCGTVGSMDLIFPNPGDSVEKLGGSTASTATAGPTSCPAGSGSAATVGAGSGSVTSVTSAASSATTAASASSPAVSGGVFVTAISSEASTTLATSVATPAAASKNTPVASTPVASSAAPVGTGTTASGSAIAAGTACTTEGMWNCIGGTSFQQCASGAWSAVQPVAAGTKCTGGESMSMGIAASGSKIKRSIRSPRIRRHIQNSNSI